VSAVPAAAEAPEQPRYEGLRRRLLAAFLDNAVWFFGYLWVFGSLPRPLSATVVGIITVVFATAWFNYFALTEWRFGQTIGKNALDMRVTTEDGKKLSYNAAALRNLMRIVDTVAALLVFGLVLMHRSPRRQRFGDRVAHTVVVHSPRTGAPAPPRAPGGPARGDAGVAGPSGERPVGTISDPPPEG
jgi:uncharacterized RDD family membrane protein YckC